jgi:hypothetical protein
MEKYLWLKLTTPETESSRGLNFKFLKCVRIYSFGAITVLPW